MRFLFAALALAAAGGVPVAAQDGAAAFDAHCRSCHAREAGAEPGPGPNLAGLAGRRIAGDPEFDYSPAMSRAQGTWDAGRLERWLTSPDDEIPGNFMGNALRDPAARAAIIRLFFGG